MRRGRDQREAQLVTGVGRTDAGAFPVRLGLAQSGKGRDLGELRPEVEVQKEESGLRATLGLAKMLKGRTEESTFKK